MTSGLKTAIGIVIALLLVGIGYYGVRHGEEIANTTTATTTEVGGGTNGKKIPFSDFVQRGGTYECTVTQIVNNTQANGVTYLQNGMIRGDFITKYQGQDVSASFIIGNDYTYIWNSLMVYGFKLKNDSTVTATTSSGTITASPATYLQTIGDYDCKEWAGDPAKFVPPTNITFQAAP